MTERTDLVRANRIRNACGLALALKSRRVKLVAHAGDSWTQQIPWMLKWPGSTWSTSISKSVPTSSAPIVRADGRLQRRLGNEPVSIFTRSERACRVLYEPESPQLHAFRNFEYQFENQSWDLNPNASLAHGTP
jgi:hypothetical protein